METRVFSKRNPGTGGRSQAAHGLFTPLAWVAVAGVLAALLAAACSLPCGEGCRAEENDRVLPVGAPVPVGGGRAVIGKPYFAYGRWFYPRAEPDYDTIGTSAWMARRFHGRRTANGEIHDSTALVAAHPTLPLPSYVRVTNIANGRELVLRLNDRGPFNNGRILDVSEQAAEMLGFRNQGLAKVRVRYLGPAPLNGDTSYEDHFLVRQPWLTCDRRADGRAVRCWPVERAAGPVRVSAGNAPAARRKWAGF
ncbi:MAG: septal ring lytic transglycosylase RlpA family protein [Rhizobiales bacterium]|nr:septal ring lytic transglycosylase RlpA family protein [Hyphomicrobiales bacterium]